MRQSDKEIKIVHEVSDNFTKPIFWEANVKSGDIQIS